MARLNWGPRFRNAGLPLPLEDGPAVPAPSTPFPDLEQARRRIAAAACSNRPPDIPALRAGFLAACASSEKRLAAAARADRDELLRERSRRIVAMERMLARLDGAPARRRSPSPRAPMTTARGVRCGTTVMVRDEATGEAATYRLVETRERPGDVTPASPVGGVLLGASVGDRVRVRIGEAERVLTLIAVS